MATIHISDLNEVRDLSALLDRVRQGDEIVFTDGEREVAVLHAPMPPRRTIDECIALLPEDSPVVDEDFARDVAAAVEWHREPLDSSRWD
jgi:antitoxin (DNA-binding transcriptional repressor) of toxin-antitoxin stability system